MSKKLLLADDSLTIQKVVALIFAGAEYDLECANNGDAALEKVRLARPDIVLADVHMPGRNGYELCTAIKADAALSGIPVLILAGTFEPFDEDKARSAGADGWIVKPFESQALIDKVEGLLASAKVAAPVSENSPASAEADASADADMWAELGLDNLGLEPEVAESSLADDELADLGANEPWTDEELLTEDRFETEAVTGDSGTADEDFLFIDEGDLLEEELAETAAPSASEMDFTFDEVEAAETESLAEAAEPQVEPLPKNDPAPAAPAAPIAVPQAPGGSPVSETPGQEALSETEVLQRVQAISDEQLDRIVERVAGVVIERLAGSILERIAWEVVPDLAEGMIKEEIRKITETSH